MNAYTLKEKGHFYELGVVVHACKSQHLGGGDRRIQSVFQE